MGLSIIISYIFFSFLEQFSFLLSLLKHSIKQYEDDDEDQGEDDEIDGVRESEEGLKGAGATKGEEEEREGGEGILKSEANEAKVSVSVFDVDEDDEDDEVLAVVEAEKNSMRFCCAICCRKGSHEAVSTGTRPF